MSKSRYILFLAAFALLHLQYFVAQTNLVNNNDFEIYDTCPENLSQPNDPQIEYCLGWRAPTEGTSDFYNSCSSLASQIDVPLNFCGYENAYSGNGYIGFYTNDKFTNTIQCIDFTGTQFYREYVQAELNYPLEIGKVYYLSFYISLADSCFGYAAKNVGALFTDNPIGFQCFRPIIANPQIISPNFVTQTTGWTKVEGYFVSNGGEQYITFGNYNDTLDFEHDTLCFKPNTVLQDQSGASYYYLDGVTLKKVSDFELPNVISPNDDGINDYIDFSLYFRESLVSVSIINRWGDLVVQLDTVNPVWKGTDTKGKELSNGVYFFVAKYQSIDKTLSGFIQLTN